MLRAVKLQEKVLKNSEIGRKRPIFSDFLVIQTFSNVQITNMVGWRAAVAQTLATLHLGACAPGKAGTSELEEFSLSTRTVRMAMRPTTRARPGATNAQRHGNPKEASEIA